MGVCPLSVIEFFERYAGNNNCNDKAHICISPVVAGEGKADGNDPVN